jgi:hypothetical protein
MRKLTALVAATVLAMSALPATAGVVITQKQHMTSGTNNRDAEQTISVQGNKQKMVTERHTIITDLDKGMMYVLDPKTKTYFEVPFPPKGQMAMMMASSTAAAMNFKKAGTTREVAGYKCADYDGGGHMMAGTYTIKECFSTSAPGAAEYAAFEKNMTEKLRSAGAQASGEVPSGMPLALDSSMKMGNVNVPGMSPEQAAKINEMMAKRPPVTTSSVVEKIENKKLAGSEFEVPADYTKRQLPAQALAAPGGGGKPAPGGMRMVPMPPAGAPSAAASPAQ